MGFTRKHALPGVVLGFLILMALGCWIWVLTRLASPQAAPNAAHSSAVIAKTQTALADLPLRFEPNVGQSASGYDYLCRTPGANLYTRPTQAALVLRAPSNSAGGDRQTLRMRLVGANADAPGSGADLLPSRSHYFIGSDPKRWHRNVPNYAGIRYTGVYPSVDLHYYGRDGQLEYDFELAPWADPEQVRLQFDGPHKVALAEDGSLRLILEGGEARQHPPVAYQMEGAKRKLVQVAYRVEDRQVGFNLGEYDRSRPLIIDPVMTYSSYLGGSGADSASAVAVDASGQMVLTGSTASVDFPTVSARDDAANGNNDVFITRLSKDGRQVVFSTYLGGTGADAAKGIVLDSLGNLCVVGQTASNTFPRQGAYQTAAGGGTSDAFVSCLSANGADLLYSTFLGGEGADVANGVAVDNQGMISVVGATSSTAFPTKAPLSPSLKGTKDAFVARLNAATPGPLSLVYSTYLGGIGVDSGHGIAIDSSRNFYVAGCTASADFHSTPQRPFAGVNDAFALRMNAAGTGIAYFTYLGGAQVDQGTGIAVQEREDGSRFAYVTGWTRSSDYPTLNPFGYASGGADVFVTKLNSTGAIFYSTYVGGTGDDQAAGIAVDPTGTAFVAGHTNSTDYPITGNRLHPFQGGKDAFLTRLNLFGDQLLYSTYLGGNGDDHAMGVAADETSTAYVVGVTASTNFPVKNGVQPLLSGGTDAFIARITHLQPPTNLTAKPTVVNPDAAEAAIGTRLNWKDNSPDETGFEIERKRAIPTDSFTHIATVKANTTTYVDNAVSDKTVQYVYRVRAVNKSGASAYSNEAMVVLPAPVTDVVARAIGTSQAVITWQDNAYNEVGFEIQRRTNNSLTWDSAGNANPVPGEGGQGAFTDSGLAANTTYTYRIRAVNANGPSEWSEEQILTTLGAPVLTLAVALDTTTIKLVWTDNSTTESGFNIERAEPDPANPAAPGAFVQVGGNPTVGANVTTFTQTGLTGDQTYWYRVRAVNASGGHVSDYSAQPPAVPAPVITTLAPSGLSGASQSTTSIALNWTDNSTKEGAPAGVGNPGFKIERRLLPSGVFGQVGTAATNAYVDLNGVFQNPTGGVGFTDGGVSADKSYEYRLRAFNATGDSSYSNLITVMTRPAKPTNLVATLVAANKAHLSWTDNSITEVGYKIERKAGIGGYQQIATVGANVVAYDDVPLTDLTLYTYRVRAYNAGGDSDYSNEASVATAGNPLGLTASAASPTRINLFWIDTAASELGFEVERKETGGAFAVIGEVQPNTATFADEDVELNKVYTYRVRAFNASQSPHPVGYSNEATATLSPLGKPSNLAGTAITSRRINLTWNDNSTTETGFQIQRAKQTFDAVGAPQPLVFQNLVTVGANATRYSDQTLNDPVAPWFYRIRAVSGQSSSAWESMAAGIITLPAPTNLKASPTTYNIVVEGQTVPQPGVQLTWSDNAGTESGYEIERRNAATGAVWTTTVGAGSTWWLDRSFSPEYVYRVRAMGVSSDRSLWSNEAMISP